MVSNYDFDTPASTPAESPKIALRTPLYILRDPLGTARGRLGARPRLIQSQLHFLWFFVIYALHWSLHDYVHDDCLYFGLLTLFSNAALAASASSPWASTAHCGQRLQKRSHSETLTSCFIASLVAECPHFVAGPCFPFFIASTLLLCALRVSTTQRWLRLASSGHSPCDPQVMLFFVVFQFQRLTLLYYTLFVVPPLHFDFVFVPSPPAESSSVLYMTDGILWLVYLYALVLLITFITIRYIKSRIQSLYTIMTSLNLHNFIDHYNHITVSWILSLLLD